MSRAKAIRPVAAVLIVTALFVAYRIRPHAIEERDSEAAARLEMLTRMPASSFREAKHYRANIAYRLAFPRYSFVASPEVIERVIAALAMHQDKPREMPVSRANPQWRNDAVRESVNIFVHYQGVSIEMWVSPKDGRCFLFNTRGT